MRISDWSSDVCSSDLIIAKVTGPVVFGKDYKAKRKIGIQPEDGGEVVEYLVPKSKAIDVQEGDYVKRGDNLIGGSPDPHDILEVLGIEALSEYMVAEIQEVYRLQGVKNNDRSEEQTSELQSLMRISYAVFCLKIKKNNNTIKM